jgi:hypothetical protein
MGHQAEWKSGHKHGLAGRANLFLNTKVSGTYVTKMTLLTNSEVTKKWGTLGQL